MKFNKIKKLYSVIILFCIMSFTTGCAMVDLAVNTGKVVVGAAKVAGGVVVTTGKVAVNTTKAIAHVVSMPTRRKVITLEKSDDNLVVYTLINRKVNAKLIVDTGCTTTQISRKIADKLGININKCKDVKCTLADGSAVTAKAFVIKELRVNTVKAFDVDAVILDNNKMQTRDGLLGMSFLNKFVFRVDAQKRELVLERRYD